ncbi:hypothetical protein GCM10027589_46710 [Actinocorallia lasiicapitis]
MAVEGLAEGGEGGEADGLRAAVLQDGEVGLGDADAVGQLGEGEAPGGEEMVEVEDDAVFFRRHQTTAARSSRRAQPR